MPRSSRIGRRPDGFWSCFNSWWRQFYDATGARPKVTDIESWCKSLAYAAAWPNGDGPTVEQAVTHSKGMRPLAEVRRYFAAYRQKKALQRKDRKAGQWRRRGRNNRESDDPDYDSLPAGGSQGDDQGDIGDLVDSGAEDDIATGSQEDQRLEQRMKHSGVDGLLGPSSTTPGEHSAGWGATATTGGAPKLGSEVGPSGSIYLSEHANAQLALLQEFLYGSAGAAAGPALISDIAATGVTNETASNWRDDLLRRSGSAGLARGALSDEDLVPGHDFSSGIGTASIKGAPHQPAAGAGGSNLGTRWPQISYHALPHRESSMADVGVNSGPGGVGLLESNMVKPQSQSMLAQRVNDGSNVLGQTLVLEMVRPRVPGGQERGGIPCSSRKQGGGHDGGDDGDWMPFAGFLGPTSPDPVMQLLTQAGGLSPGTGLLGVLQSEAPGHYSPIATTGTEPCNISPPSARDPQPPTDAVTANTSLQTAFLTQLRPKVPGGEERGIMSNSQQGRLRHLSAGSCTGDGSSGDGQRRLALLPTVASTWGIRRPAEPQPQNQYATTLFPVRPGSTKLAFPTVGQRRQHAGDGGGTELVQHPHSPQQLSSQDLEERQRDLLQGVGGSTPRGQALDESKGGALRKRVSEASRDGGLDAGPLRHRRRVRRSAEGQSVEPNDSPCYSYHASRSASKADGSSGSDSRTLARQRYSLGAGQDLTGSAWHTYPSAPGDLVQDVNGAHSYGIDPSRVAPASALYGRFDFPYKPGALCPLGRSIGPCYEPHHPYKGAPLSDESMTPYQAAAVYLQPYQYLAQQEQQQPSYLAGLHEDALTADTRLIDWLFKGRHAEVEETENATGQQAQAGMPTAAAALTVEPARHHEGLQPPLLVFDGFHIPGKELSPTLPLGRQPACYAGYPGPSHCDGNGAFGGPLAAAALSVYTTTGMGLGIPVSLSPSAYYAALTRAYGSLPYGPLGRQSIVSQHMQHSRLMYELLGSNVYNATDSVHAWATAAFAAMRDLGVEKSNGVRFTVGCPDSSDTAQQDGGSADTGAGADGQVGGTAGGTADDADAHTDVESFFSQEAPV